MLYTFWKIPCLVVVCDLLKESESMGKGCSSGRTSMRGFVAEFDLSS